MAVKLGEYEVRDVSIIVSFAVSIESGHACTEYKCMYDSNAPLVAGLNGRVLQEHRRVPSCFQAGTTDPYIDLW